MPGYNKGKKMKHLFMIVFGLLLVGGAFSQVIPPINLQAELLQAGGVDLTWEEPGGLVEDFEDGLAQGFEILTTPGTYVIDTGYFKMDLVPNTTTWGSGTYNDLEFDDLTVTSTFEIQNASTSSRGILWRCNGPRDADFAGYGMYISSTSYSVWRYANAVATNLVGWTTSPDILTGQGAVNTLSVTAIGSNFDLYINGTYQGSTTDATYTTGFAGLIAAYSTITWYDDIEGMFEVGGAPGAPAQIGEPVVGNFDDMGNPVDYDIVTVGDGLFDRYGEEPYTNELDEFVEYRIYRDGDQVGTSLVESYTDNLPGLGTYDFTVTAFYDEGESGGAGPVTVVWDPVFLTLTGQITEIPAEGGNMMYDATVFNTLPQNFTGVTYWTGVTFPNGQVFGPLSRIPVTIPAFFNETVFGLFQEIPWNAPAGEYMFEGHLGIWPNSSLSDSFPFTKLGGPSADSFTGDPLEWANSGMLAFGETGEKVALPTEYLMTEAYPNPFNPSTSFSVVLPDAADLTVTVYNIAGQQVATVANGQFSAGQHNFSFDASGMASGLYFIRANVPGKFDQINKVTLIR
jgi:Secretion system C-terminal sorting domain